LARAKRPKRSTPRPIVEQLPRIDIADFPPSRSTSQQKQQVSRAAQTERKGRESWANSRSGRVRWACLNANQLRNRIGGGRKKNQTRFLGLGFGIGMNKWFKDHDLKSKIQVSSLNPNFI
jgi:hypothetical protein